MTTKRDYYTVIGCARDAAPEEIRRAYKREALKHHPDRNPGDHEAEVRFKEINEAYQVLSDEEKRSIYDQFGHDGLRGRFDGAGDVFSHMQDMFSEMFSGGFGQSRQRRGGDLRVQIRLTLREAAFGVKREVTLRAPVACDDCSATGVATGSKPEACAQCRGTGQVSTARGFVMFSSPCGRCQGRGNIIKNPCKSCSGHGAVERTRKVTVTFPAGVDSGQRLRVSGQGISGPGIQPGDLFVDLDVEEDRRFERDGADLLTRVHISFTAAANGATITVPTLSTEDDSTTSLEVPVGTQPGAVFTLKNEGVPRLDGRGRGALLVVVQVDVPTVLSARARELLAEFEAEVGAKAAPPRRKSATGDRHR